MKGDDSPSGVDQNRPVLHPPELLLAKALLGILVQLRVGEGEGSVKVERLKKGKDEQAG